MNLDSLSFALSQISYSVANLTKKNYKSSIQEISHLIAQHGAEADRHLFRCLFSHVDFSGDGKSSGKDFHQTQYLIQECASLISKPNFVSTLCHAIDTPLHHQKSLKVSTHLLGQLSRILKLTPVQEVVFAIALQQSANPDTRQHATLFLKQKLPQLIDSYIDIDTTTEQEGGLQDIAIEVLHSVLTELTYSQDNLGISAQQKDKFLKAIRKDFPKERTPAILSPLLHPEPGDIPISKLNLEVVNLSPLAIMDGSLADMIREVGYGFTASLEECRTSLAQFGLREIPPRAVARVLGMMSQTAAGLSDPITIQAIGSGSSSQWTDGKDKQDSNVPTSWNVNVFVQVLRDVAPQLSWKEVVGELDYPEFRIASKGGLQLLVNAFYRGFPQPLAETFPIDILHRPWTNTEGQLSWIVQSLKNPDVFCFSDYPCHTVVIDILKTPPDEKIEINTWKSLDLVETLLRLSEHGHYQNISELFKFPVMNCPDMLVLALLQIPTWNTLKHELLSGLMPTFLGNHPNSAMVLHYAWHCQELLSKKLSSPEDIWNHLLEIKEEKPWFSARTSLKPPNKQPEGQSTTIRTLVMHAMAEWYMRGEHHDQSRLSRILDVAQDLKALSMLLNATPFAFVIDLACLASRREYLKLDKWLSDKIREHGEPFVQACVHFLKRRCSQLMGGAVKDDQGPQSKAQQLPPETVGAMLACLQACASNVAQELSENIYTMVTNASAVLQKRQGAPTPTSAIVGPPKGGLGPSLQGIPNPATPPTMEAIGLGGLGQLGPQVGPPPAPQPTSSITTSPFPASLGSLTSNPGSPAKSFPSLGQVTGSGVSTQGPAFNPMQTLTSQLQGLSMQTTMSTGMPSTSVPVSRPSGAPTLGALSGAALKQQQQPPPPTTETLRRVPSGMESTFKADLPASVAGQPPTGDVSSIFPNMSQQFSKEIEDEANSYFQRIYNAAPHPTLSIDEVLEMLKRFKDSPNKKERDVYACMLRNLFEEYRFFPQYPDRELHTTAVLFGGIIEQRLVTYMDLGIALRYVLEALKKPHGSKMYFFGIAALDRFKTRLKIYPQYCQFLEAIPHFAQFPPALKEYIEYGARSQEPPYRPPQPQQGMPMNTGSVTPTSLPATSAPAPVAPTPASTAPAPAATTTTNTPVATHGAIGGSRPHQSAPSRPSIATATNIDTLLAGTEGKEEFAVPPEQVQDKVFFIFNNLSLANMDQKAQELKENIGDEYMLWVAQYLVMKRASIEHNFHTLYANFIDHLKKGENFIQMVIRETHRNIQVLLRSDKGVANYSDRSLLKNLGHWLGLLTLARNKPILQLDIDLKSLLYEAYHKGQQELLYVVPFVAKVIESCAKSKVFKPPNPWTMAIMNVLAELHQEPDLKLNLKFEIEVLCKNLNLDINDLTAGHYLADTERMNTLEFQLSDPSKKTESSSTPQPEEPLQINMPTPTTAAPPAVPITTTTTTTPVVVPPQPQFGYHEINVMSLAGLSAHINVNDNLAIFQQNPNLRQYVRTAIERSVQELLPPVVERSIKIALTTSEQIVKKDFALDPEESRMRAAAHHMVRFMTAGMALITCREPLVLSINNNLKQAFLSQIRGATQQQKDMIEHAAHVLAQDNVELACAFIQKTAVEKAIPEMDKRLATEYELRKHARNEGRRYCDPIVLTYQAERMPEQIRLKVGGVTHQQFAVYEEIARNIPGFLPTAQEAAQSVPVSAKPPPAAQPPQLQQSADMPTVVPDDVTQIYDKIAQEIGQVARNMIAPPGNQQVAAVGTLMETIMMARSSAFDIMSAVRLVHKAVEGLLEGLQGALNPQSNEHELMMRFRDCHVLVLRAMQDPRAYGANWTNKMVTRYLIECRDEQNYNVDAMDCLIRHHLISMQQYDMHLAQSMENGLNYMATAFAMQILQRFFVKEKDSSIGEGEFFNTIETLARIAVHSRQAPAGLTALIDSIRSSSDSGLLERAPGGPTSMMHSGISQAREFDDPPGLHDKTEYLLREWVNMYHSPAAGRDSYKAFPAFVAQMHQQGILKTDDLITRFFRLCTEMCVDLCYRALSEHNQSPTLIRAKCFHTLDAFVRLIALLVKHSGDTTNTVTKINLLNKVLGIVAGVLLQDHEVRHTEFQQLPYHRIFIMLFIEVNAPEHVLESINFQVLTAFCNTFHILRPAKAPGFAYAWLELVSHRVFIGRMLAITPQQRSVTPSGDNAHPGWSMYAQLLLDLFKFLAPFLRNAELTKPTHLLYKGTLRVLLVLLHDFPEFLCDYHYTFCDVIPPNCVQMRNLILSAFPRNMRLPDPFTPNLKVDMLPEISAAPRIMTNFANSIQPQNFKKDLESYLKTRSPVTFLSELRSKLQMQISSEPGMRYNLPMMNALVLYVGTQAIAYIHSKGLTPSMSTIAHSSHMDIFQNLAVDLDTEGRFLFLNAIANQLRYPNSHTHYFSCTLLYLFAEANAEAIQEQITRVLLERLIVNRPHPWGLLITFIELIKNPQFKFWSHDFVHCAPEIGDLFESVARSCMQPKQPAQGMREHESAEIH